MQEERTSKYISKTVQHEISLNRRYISNYDGDDGNFDDIDDKVTKKNIYDFFLEIYQF